MENEVRKERNELLVRGLNLLSRFSAEDQHSVSNYYQHPSLLGGYEKNVEPWRRLMGETADFQSEVLKFMKKHSVDETVFCDLSLPPALLSLGGGGEYTDNAIKGIGTILNRTKEALKNVSDDTLLKNASEEVLCGEKANIHFHNDPCHLLRDQGLKKSDFKRDDDKQTILIRAAFSGEVPLGEWIDRSAQCIDGSLEGRKLYDSARHINKKLMSELSLKEDFFQVDCRNKRVRVKAEAFNIEIVQ